LKNKFVFNESRNDISKNVLKDTNEIKKFLNDKLDEILKANKSIGENLEIVYKNKQVTF
jgi:hypothetical protein